MPVVLHVDKRIFNEAYYPHLHNNARVQIYFGGSSSGKSFFIAGQRAVLDVAEGGHNYLCVRNVKNTVKTSIFNEVCKGITALKLDKHFKINQSDFVITCANGYQILFGGLDDVQKIKSITPAKGVITNIIVEEATETTEDDIKQLQRRLRGRSQVAKTLTMLFNPILQDHWICRVYFTNWDDSSNYYNDSKVSILKTTYLDNLRFLEPDDIALLEDETDPYYRNVYTLGNWGVLGNVIFKNWEVRDLRSEMIDIGDGTQVPLISTFDKYKNGLDFGFSSDPAAVVRMHYDKNHKTIYITDEIYMREMTNDVLGKEVKELIGGEYITCDSAEPKSIRDLQVMGIRALGARKGKDSVNFGIDWLQRQKIVIDTHCQNTKNEFQQYKWKESADGMVLKVPVDKNNHILDAVRYAMQDEMEGRRITAEKAF